VLIARDYRGDIDMSAIDKFIGLVMDREDEGSVTPLIQTQEATFTFIKHNNLYVVATTKKNSNVAMMFSLLHKICSVI
jgi:AP-1 complex subunit mu